jgi:hypothetical protein
MPALLRTVVIAALLTACGRTDRPAIEKRGYDEAPASAPAPARDAAAGITAGRAMMAEAEPGSPATMPPVAQDPAATPAMIIRTGQASIEIDSLEEGVARLRALAAEVGGFVANSQMQTARSGIRSATLEIKVPSQKFDALLAGLSPIGKVEYVNVTAQDVGEEFTDVTARVANSRRLEQRLIDLLATRTGKLSDVLEIERELARVREGIERMEGRLRYLKAHVATSTLTVTVHEPGPIVSDGGSLGAIGEAFRQAWRNFVGFMAGLIASLGVLLPVGALVVAALWGLRKVWRARRTS